MTDTPTKARDYSETLFLPKTDFPMPAFAAEELERWRWIKLGLYAPAGRQGRTRLCRHHGRPTPTAISTWARHLARCSRTW